MNLKFKQIPNPRSLFLYKIYLNYSCNMPSGLSVEILLFLPGHTIINMRMHLTGNGRLCAAKGSNLNNNIPLMHLQVQVQRHKKRDRNAIPAPVTNINTT